MWEAGIRSAVLTIASTKQDIRTHYANSYSPDPDSTDSLALFYANADDSPNTPTSIDAAYESTRGKICALGFGDLLYRPCPGYRRALAMLKRGNADVVLGLFPTDQAQAVDMVAFDANGRVRDIHIKTLIGERFAYTWSLAVWQPSFTKFLRDWVAAAPAARDAKKEAYVGDVLLAAIDRGLRVDAVAVSTAKSLDAGTPETLARAQSALFS